MSQFRRLSQIALCALLPACLACDVVVESCYGFASTPSSWTVPYDFTHFDAFTQARGRAGSWTLTDLTGDGLADLVVTSDPISVFHNEDETEWWWELYPSTGEDFGPRQIFRLPDEHLTRAWHANEHYLIADFDGDQRPDLLRAIDPITGALYGAPEDPHWQLYPGTADGFGPGQRWDIPDPIFTQGVGWNLFNAWDILDLDGDGIQELVHTADPASAEPFDVDGAPHWRVYPIDGSGFAATPVLWPVPLGPDGAGWFGSVSQENSQRAWRLLDLNGDGAPELVQSRDPAAATAQVWTERGPHWRVHWNEGDGFALDWTRWRLPDEMFDYPAAPTGYTSAQTVTWDSFDIGGGGTADLVLATDPDTEGPFEDANGPQWAAFFNTGRGFAARHEPWELPGGQYHRLWNSDTAGGVGAWDTLDINGDGCFDLVESSPGSDDEPHGSAETGWYWQVWLGVAE